MFARRECGVPWFVAGGICAALLLSAPLCFAADDDDDDEDKTEKPAEKPAEPVKATPTEGPKAVAPGTSDHSQMVGRIGLGWFGMSSVPIATGAPGGSGDYPQVAGAGVGSVSTPVLGMRMWLNERMGLDIGGGFSISAGAARTVTNGAEKAAIYGFLAHGGLPLSIATGKHISLQLIPEMNLGFAVSSVEPVQQPNPPPNATLTGVRLDLGARVGGEVHFGFMDIPELSLEGSVGAFLTYQATNISVGEAFSVQRNVLFATASYQNPWDIFTSYVRARYYF